jgi:multiple sugar transport system substrate-binding protein
MSAKRQLSRREFLKSAALGGVGLVLAACARPVAPAKEEAAAPAKQETPAPKEPVNIIYWHSWTEQWEEMTQFVCDSFNEKFPDIHAEQVVIPGAERTTKFLSAVAAGNPPDMVTIYSAMGIPSFVEQDALIALENEQDIAEAKEWFHPAVLALGTYEGKIWGLSYWQQTACLGWNKKTFDEVGLDREKPPTSIAELDEMAAKLTKMEGDRIDRMGHMPNYYWLWASVWGGSFYDEANRKVTANDPKIVEMFEWMASYSEKYDVTKVQAFQEGLASERAGILDPFISGRIAIHEVGGPWKLGDFFKYAEEGFEYGIIPAPNPPGVTGVATYSYGDFTVVPKGTKHPDEAWQFVKYTGGLGGTLDDYFKVLTWGGRPINVPVTTQILDHEPFKELVADFPGFQEMIDMFLKGDRVGMPPMMPVGSFYADRLNAARDKVRLLDQTPQEAMDQVTEEVQKELDDFYASQ